MKISIIVINFEVYTFDDMFMIYMYITKDYKEDFLTFRHMISHILNTCTYFTWGHKCFIYFLRLSKIRGTLQIYSLVLYSVNLLEKEGDF